MTFSVRTKLVVGFGVMLLLLAIVGGLGWLSVSGLAGEYHRLYEVNLKGAVQLANAEEALWRLRYGFPQFLVLTSAEDHKKITDAEPKLYELVEENMRAYAAGVRSTDEQQLLKEWNEWWPKYRGARPRWFELVAAGKMAEAADYRAQTTTPFGAAAVKTLSQLIELQRKVAEERYQGVASESRRTVVMVIVLLAVAIAISGTLALVIGRSIVLPLRQTAAMMRSITGERDLRQRVPVRSRDELGEVAASFNGMISSIHDVIAEARDTAEHTAAASQQLSAAASQLSSGVQEQAASLEETAASLEEITATVKQNAENAQQASSLAGASSGTAEKGGRVVGEAVSSMGEINQASKRIADIITAIDEIAFQTNLLALNAAVEAARAGEQGRGFAVVAAEVRNLAQRSATAAKEIKTLIKDSVNKVESGSALVNQSGETLGEIVVSVKRVTDIIGEIAAASREQSAGIDQVNRAVTQMDRVTQSNAAQTEELTATAQALADQAQRLRLLVGQFQVDQRVAAQSPTRPVSYAEPRPVTAPAPVSPLRRMPEPALVGGGSGNGSGNGTAAHARHDDFGEF
jgi:methyl-accepting chemotaxis protein